jgi:hypothetical protein
MIYLIRKDGMVIPHTDLAAMKELDGAETPDMTVTEAEWEAAEGIARVIDGEIFLGKTEEEKRSEKEAEVKAKRDRILLETVDRVNGVRWEAMDGDEKEKWREYRQALLDIPEQEGYPDTVVWPEIPE